MRHFFAVFCFIFSLSLLAQESSSPLDAPDLEPQKIWVDSTYTALSLKEKIGQLYIIQVFSNQDQATKKSILNQICKPIQIDLGFLDSNMNGAA